MLPSLNRPSFTPVEGIHPLTGFQLYPQTDYVLPDEDISSLWEMNLLAPGFESRRRYQVIIVNRPIDGNAAKAQFMYDMGLADLYPAKPIQIPGFWVVTVAEAQDAANEFRLHDMEYQMGIGVSDLVAGYHDEIDIQHRQMERVSQFGPLHTVQRSY